MAELRDRTRKRMGLALSGTGPRGRKREGAGRGVILRPPRRRSPGPRPCALSPVPCAAFREKGGRRGAVPENGGLDRETTMAGHSHAANVMYKKAAVDRKRAVLFSKVARLIIVAARTGGGDPHANIRLKFAVEKARAANMTNDAIKRAIQKGTGEGSTEVFDEVTYEGYGQGGVAGMAPALTNNRARTAGEVKNVFERRGGNPRTPGSVAWQFTKNATRPGAPGSKSGDEGMRAVRG